MKRILGLLLILLLLGGVSFYLWQTKGTASDNITNSGFDLSDRQFAVEDPNEVTAIMLDRPRYPKMTFTKEGNIWKINNIYEANETMIPNLLNVLSKVKVDYIPTRAEVETIRKDLKKNGIQIKVFGKNGEILKSYQVGSQIANGVGSPYLMDGATQPYIMHIPGFVGSLRTRLTYNLEEFRSKVLFREDPTKLKEVEILYPRDNESSFLVRKADDGTYDVYRPGLNEPEDKANQKSVKAFLNNFRNVIAEYNDAENDKKGMITSQPLFAQIKTTDDNGVVKTYKLYSYIDITNDVSTTSPKNIREDNKFFIETSEGEFLLTQYRVFKNVLKHHSWFMVQF